MVFSPEILFRNGLFLIALVSTPVSLADKIAPRMESVSALLDTGATTTSIDVRLAEKLGLPVWGASKIHTAAGLVDSVSYLADISFPSVNLGQMRNLSISSCELPYSPEKPPALDNFAMLIGRDIMSHWTIVWNGPSSSVFISD
jgi:predicted aspartyl protease